MKAKYMPGQEPTEETAEQYQARIAPLVSEVAEIMETVGSEELDSWERECYTNPVVEKKE